jgi:hypothetical protein
MNCCTQPGLTEALYTRMLNYEFRNDLSFTTWGEPKRDHHRHQFVYYSVLSVATKRLSIPCQRFDFYQRIPCRGYAFLVSSCLTMDYSASIRCRWNVLTEPLPSNGHIRHSYSVFTSSCLGLVLLPCMSVKEISYAFWRFYIHPACWPFFSPVNSSITQSNQLL